MALYVDDNNRVVSTPTGLRPTGKTTGIITATMSASVQALTLPTGTANVHGEYIYRLVGTTTAVLYAVDASGASASYGDATKMIFVPATTVEYFKTNSTDTTVYVVQGGTAGVVQVALMQ